MRKIIAMICVVALMLSLAASAFARECSPTTGCTDPDCKCDCEGCDCKNGNCTCTDCECECNKPTPKPKPNKDTESEDDTEDESLKWFAVMDLTGYDSILEEPLTVTKVGFNTYIIPPLSGYATLEDFIVVLTKADNSVLYAKLIDWKSSYKAQTGEITIYFPATGTFDILRCF